MYFIPLFQSFPVMTLLSRGDALRSAQRLPLAVIFRAFGAAQKLSAPWFCANYPAPLVLRKTIRAFGAAQN